MPTTTKYGLRYPASTDTADIPRDVGNLATDVEAMYNRLAYVEFTANVTVPSAAETSPADVVVAPSITLDGATRIVVEFYAEALFSPGVSSANVTCNLWGDGANLGRIAAVVTPAAVSMAAPCYAQREFLPAAGAHVYSIRCWSSSAGGLVLAGAGGAGNAMPGFIRIRRA